MVIQVIPDMAVGSPDTTAATIPDHQVTPHTLEAKGLSPRTIAYTRAVLRRSLGHAQRWDKVGRNVAALVDAPRKASVKPR